jgi:hypothetical protein
MKRAIHAVKSGFPASWERPEIACVAPLFGC